MLKSKGYKTTCKNCNNAVEQHFCGVCGQAANTHRITAHQLLHDLQHSFFHFDNGIFYTVSQLITRPGYAIKEYVDGKRIKHYKPIALVVVVATIYGLLYHLLITHIPQAQNENTTGLRRVFETMLNLMMNHLAYSSIFIIITASISSYFLFKHKGFNFAEHIVLNTYYTSLVLIIEVVLFPLLLILEHTQNSLVQYYGYASAAIQLMVLWWIYRQFFNLNRFFNGLILTLVSFSLMIVLTFVMLAIATLAISFINK